MLRVEREREEQKETKIALSSLKTAEENGEGRARRKMGLNIQLAMSQFKSKHQEYRKEGKKD